MWGCSYFLLFLTILAALSAAQEGEIRHRHRPGRLRGDLGQMQLQPIGFRRIRIQRVRPGAHSTTSPEGATPTPKEGIVDWGVEAITNDPYTFYHRRPEAEDAAREEMDAAERERHERLQKMKLLQWQRELPRPLSQGNNDSDTSQNVSIPEVDATRRIDLTRKRNCTIQNTTSGSVLEICAEVSSSEQERKQEEEEDYSEPDNRQDWIVRERTKQARLFMIQASILHKLGLRRQPSLTKLRWSDNQTAKLMEAFRGLGDPYAEAGRYNSRRLSLHQASCDLPCNTHRDWVDGSRFRLYFHILPPRWQVTKITTASLRLYKRAVPDCDCNILRPENTRQRERGSRRRHQRRLNHRQHEADLEALPTPTQAETTGASQEEDKIRIAVYAYQRPIRARRKERASLLDFVTVARSFEGYLKLDIRRSVTTWFSNPVKNYGLQVRVWDSQRRELDPFSVITPTNCTLHNNFSLPYPLAVTDNDVNNTNADVNQTAPYLKVVLAGNPQTYPLNWGDTTHAQVACGLRADPGNIEAEPQEMRNPPERALFCIPNFHCTIVVVRGDGTDF